MHQFWSIIQRVGYYPYYASENVDEFIAEGVAEYLNGGTRPLSRQIVKIVLGG